MLVAASCQGEHGNGGRANDAGIISQSRWHDGNIAHVIHGQFAVSLGRGLEIYVAKLCNAPAYYDHAGVDEIGSYRQSPAQITCCAPHQFHGSAVTHASILPDNAARQVGLGGECGACEASGVLELAGAATDSVARSKGLQAAAFAAGTWGTVGQEDNVAYFSSVEVSAAVDAAVDDYAAANACADVNV